MSELPPKNIGPEGKKPAHPLDIEFNAFLDREPEDNPASRAADEGYRELTARRLAEARDKKPKVDAAISFNIWLREKYPAITGKMTVDELMAFLKEEKKRIDGEIEKKDDNLSI